MLVIPMQVLRQPQSHPAWGVDEAKVQLLRSVPVQTVYCLSYWVEFKDKEQTHHSGDLHQLYISVHEPPCYTVRHRSISPLGVVVARSARRDSRKGHRLDPDSGHIFFKI